MHTENVITDEQAKSHLDTVRSAYTSIGSAGAVALTLTILPLVTRWNRGERTQEFFQEILDVKL